MRGEYTKTLLGTRCSQSTITYIDKAGHRGLTAPAHAAVTVGSIGVGATVDGGTSRRQGFPPPLGDENHDCDNDS